MRFNKIGEIFRKEVIDTLRDRRTLLIMIVLPVLLYPGMMIFVNEVASSQQAKMEQKTLSMSVLNLSSDSELYARLKASRQFRIVQSRDPHGDVRAGSLHYVLEFPADPDSVLRNNGTLRVRLHYDRSNDDASANVEALEEILTRYREEVLDRRLTERQITREFVDPLKIEEVNVASKERMGGFVIGRFLPMMMVIMVLAGAMYPAIDMTAGEKERGTLETILTSPATRTEIVLGKFLTVTLIALLTGILNMASMTGTFAFALLRGAESAIQINLPASSLLLMLLCLLPLAVFFSGTMMAISCFARSFKEAQSMLSMVYMVATIPAMVSFIPGIQLEGFWLTLPVANVTLLFKELMLGVYDLSHVLTVFFSVVFLAAIALFAAIQLFGREEVLFGEVSSFGLTFRRSNIVPKDVPDQPEAIFFILLSLAALLYVAIPLQARDLVSGLLVTELGIFFALPILFAFYLKLDLKKTFRLKSPSFGAIGLTIVFFIGIELAVGTILWAQNEVFPIPKQLLDMMEKLLRVFNEYPIYIALLLVAVLPAVCEETTFRGLVLSGLLRRSRPVTALIATSALFAIFHLSLHRFLGVFLIGLAATFIVMRSGSIFTGMLLHFLNNGYYTVISNYPRLDILKTGELKPSPLLFAAGIAIVILAVYLSNRFLHGPVLTPQTGNKGGNIAAVV